MLFVLVAALITAGYFFLQLLINQDVYPGEILEKDYTRTQLFLQHVKQQLIEVGQSAQKSFQASPGVYYYYSDGKVIFNNTANQGLDFFLSLGEYFFGYVDNRYYGISNELNPQDYILASPGHDYMLGFDGYYIANLQHTWQNIRIRAMLLVISIAISLLGAILLFTRLVYMMSDTKDSHLAKLDFLPAELFMGALAFAVFWMSRRFYFSLQPLLFDDIISLVVTMTMAFFAVSAAEFIALTLISRIKRDALEDTLLMKKTIEAFSLVLDGFLPADEKPTTLLTKRTAMFYTVSGVMLVLIYFTQGNLWLELLFVLVLIGSFTWYILENRKTLSNIQERMDLSIQEKVQSEKSKVELITNVSHDLKTPLTSIISYVELLKKEPQSDTAREYLNILDSKAERLNQILQDVFELSKVTTGALSVDFQLLDFRRMIEMVVLDMQEDIDQSGLQLKITLPEEATYISSDPSRLYRVFQNIIDNALKYSQAGTRVFLDLVNEGPYAVMTLKNTAGYAMDFTEEQVLQRFYRADPSRATTGSGLGLSIAESFTELCGGHFTIKLDGDLFKVIMQFTRSEAPHEKG